MSMRVCVHVCRLLYVLYPLALAAEVALSLRARLVGAATSLSPGYQRVLQMITAKILQVVYAFAVDRDTY